MFFLNIYNLFYSINMLNVFVLFCRLTYIVCATILMVGILFIYCCIRRKISSLFMPSPAGSTLSKMIQDEAIKIATFHRGIQNIWNTICYYIVLHYCAFVFCSLINFHFWFIQFCFLPINSISHVTFYFFYWKIFEKLQI